MPTRDLVSRDVRQLELGGGRRLHAGAPPRAARRGPQGRRDASCERASDDAAFPIEALVRESERWVLRKIAEWSQRRVQTVAWADGVALPYLGGTFAGHHAGKRTGAERAGGELRITARDVGEPEVKRAVIRWYKRSAQGYLGVRVAALCDAAGLRFQDRASSALARWGKLQTRAARCASRGGS